MKPLVSILRSFGLLVLFTITAGQAKAQSYVIEDLGLPGGYSSIGATDINSIGQVVGTLGTATGHQRAFLWTDGTFKVLDPLPGDTDSEARGLNDQGKVVGRSWRSGASTTYNGVVWAPTYTRHLTSAGGTSVEIYDISNAGVIPGAVKRRDQWQAILWTPKGVQEIPSVERAVAVNDRDEVAGSTWEQGRPLGWLWHDGASVEIGREFDPAYYDAPTAVALNTRGQLALWVFHEVEPWAFRWTDGVYERLSSRPNYWSVPYGINDAGDVVGWSLTPDGSYGAFLYRDSTGFVDLNTKLPPGSGWDLSAARAINNRGQIVGGGVHNGQGRTFRLTPLWPRPGYLLP